MKTTEVFIAGGMPSVTYNPRTELGLENKLQDYLNTRHKLISITGPTKSGKTVLCRRNIDETQQILISGGEITGEDNFWELVLDQLNYSYVESSSAMTSSDDTVSAGISAQLSLWSVAKFGGNGTTTRKNNNGTSHTKKYIINPKRSAIEKLKSLDKTLIIDDFHYIEQSIQQQIIRALKSPIFDGLNVIVLAVPHRAYDALKVETEMTGRVAQLEITSWEERDLSEIASKGFKELNIIHDDLIINTLAQESYGSPNLMQEFCLQLCKDNNVNETCKQPKTITLLTSSKAFFKSIAKSVAFAKAPPDNVLRYASIVLPSFIPFMAVASALISRNGTGITEPILNTMIIISVNKSFLRRSGIDQAFLIVFNNYTTSAFPPAASILLLAPSEKAAALTVSFLVTSPRPRNFTPS